VLHAKIQSAKRNLEKNLFILHPILRTSLLKINSLNKEIILEKKLVYTPKQTTMELADFVREQKEYVETVTTASLKPWEQTLRVVVEDAAQKTLQARGFEIESPNSSTEPRKMTFTEQASRRGECRRLTRFVKLIDYMIVSTMQMLVINSVQELMKFSFAGCENDDVVIDNAGTGTVVINEHGIIQDSVEQTANSNNALENVHPSSSYISVQVGGVVVGKEVFTSRLAECGFDGFSDILSRLVKAAVPVIELVEVIEEEGPLLDKNDSFVEVSEIIVPSRKAEDVSKWKNNDKPKTFVPIFRTELLMNHTNQSSVLYFVSSLNDYLSTIDILLKVYLSTVEQINQITNTIYFLDSSNVSGGSYSAVRSLDELEFGDGPQVSQIILEGAYFKELCGRIRGVFVGMFGNASKWLVTLEPLKDMWVANQSFDALGSLRENVGELAYMLATSNQGEVEGGVAGILLAAYNKHIQLKAKKEIKIDPETGLSELEEPEPVFNVLEFGSTVETDEDGLAKSKLVDFFDKTLKKFANEKEIMSAIPTTSIINNLMIDSTNLKRIFVPSPERCFDEVSRLLPEISRDKNELLLTEVQSWLRILSTHPSSVESFVEYLGWLEKIRLSIETVSLLESEITQLYGILDQNKIFLLPTDVAMYQTLAPTLRTLKEQVDIAYDSKDDNISKFTVDLEKMLGDLSAEVSEIRNSAQDPMVLSASSNNDEVIGYLDELKKKLDKVEQLKITYENWGALFKRGGEMVKPVNPADAEELQGKAVQSTDNVELDETKKEVEMKTSLWTSLKDWDVLVAGWVEQSFETLVTDDINTKITQFLKISYNLDKGLPPNEVVPKLKLLVEGYRKIYPTIVDLRNPSLKARHWEKIQDSVGKVLPKYETFTLGFLLENHVFDFKDEIGHISSQAGSEASLDEMLTKVVKLWNDAEFIVTPYRDSKDVFILGTVEDIQTLLEDSQVTIATIKSSRFIGPIKGEVERWDKMLSLFAETLDAWLVCQRSWLYLESIFAAPDIQRQLPNEAKMFSQVDRSWKELMRKVAKNPNPLKSGTVPGVLETLQQNNILLEQIQKCLEDYLESKRLLFPRFYFLSNDELLEILSQTKNPQAVQPHLSKCFDAIKNLEFGSKDSKSIDIVGMNSPEGEKVPFIKTIKARGNVEGWLGNVEEAMVAVLRRLIKVALSDYKEANKNKWVKENVGQVVLTGNQVLWSKDVGDALKSSDPGKSLLALRQKSLSV
jgi:dynein heavy chain